MNKLLLLIAELVASAVLMLVLYGLYNGFIGSLVTISEAMGIWLVIFLILLVIIDIFLIAYTLSAWEHGIRPRE